MRGVRRGNTIVFVLGSHLLRDKDSVPIIAESTIKHENSSVPLCKKGQPLWNHPKTKSQALHFRNEAAKRRALKNLEAKLAANEVPVKNPQRQLILFADPKDIVRVPIYRGLDAQFATEVRADKRRNERQAAAL